MWPRAEECRYDIISLTEKLVRGRTIPSAVIAKVLPRTNTYTTLRVQWVRYDKKQHLTSSVKRVNNDEVINIEESKQISKAIAQFVGEYEN
jgi:hypothetical protein